MKRIVLYRYHHKFELNKTLLQFIKYLNPETQIFGLYGGTPEQFNEATSFLKDELSHNYLIAGKDNTWKWKHSDKAFQMWYNDYGHNVDFDIMHVIEWDLLYFESLDKLFANVTTNSVALTGLTPISKIEKEWYWVKKDPGKSEWTLLKKHFKEKYNYDQKPFGMLGPGVTFSRMYFEKLKNIDIPEIVHDELRIPMYAQVFGMKLLDTGFYKKWFSKKEWHFFNSNNHDIAIDVIVNELLKKNGRRVFHPWRNNISLDTLVEMYTITQRKQDVFIVSVWNRIKKKLNKTTN